MNPFKRLAMFSSNAFRKAFRPIAKRIPDRVYSAVGNAMEGAAGLVNPTMTTFLPGKGGLYGLAHRLSAPVRRFFSPSVKITKRGLVPKRNLAAHIVKTQVIDPMNPRTAEGMFNLVTAPTLAIPALAPFKVGKSIAMSGYIAGKNAPRDIRHWMERRKAVPKIIRHAKPVLGADIAKRVPPGMTIEEFLEEPTFIRNMAKGAK